MVVTSSKFDITGSSIPQTRKLRVKWSIGMPDFQSVPKQKKLQSLKKGELVFVWHPDWKTHALGIVLNEPSVNTYFYDVFVNESASSYYREWIFPKNETPVRGNFESFLTHQLANNIANEIDNEILKDFEALNK